MMGKHIRWMICLGVLVAAGACTKHTIETKSEVELKPIEVKPIHITIDVNIRVDRALDDFFGDLDQAATSGKAGGTK